MVPPSFIPDSAAILALTLSSGSQLRALSQYKTPYIPTIVFSEFAVKSPRLGADVDLG